MARARSRRLRLLESLRRTLSEKLHMQVWRAARGCGRAPENTAAIYAMAQLSSPELLDQLLLVHHRVLEEEGQEKQRLSAPPVDDLERKRMLSAVRATVDRTAARLGGEAHQH